MKHIIILILPIVILATGAAGDPVADTRAEAYQGQGVTAPAQSTYIAEGDSITASPNGAGVTSWSALLAGMSFFKNATYHNTAVPGALITNGSTGASGSPEAATASWTGNTAVIDLSAAPSTPGGYPIAGPMAVTGINIPFGTTGVLSSGTVLTLSNATTAGSGGTVTIHLGGNTVLDRWASQVYPHRPSANGGDGGTVSYDVIMAGANDLSVGISGSNIINALVQLTGSDEAAGITPIVSTILPDIGQSHWSYSQEVQRQLVNQTIRYGGIPGALVVDSCEALSGDANLFDGNGVHPIGQANQIVANYWNAKLQSGASDVKGTKQYVDTDETFNDPITINGGVSYSGTLAGNQSAYNTANGEWLNVLQPAMAAGQYSGIDFGVMETQYDWGALGFYFDGPTGDPSNEVVLDVANQNPFIIDGKGEASVGLTTAQHLSKFGSADYGLVVQAVNGAMPIEAINTYSATETVLGFFQPNVSTGSSPNMLFGVAQAAGQAGILSYYYAGNNSAGNYVTLGTLNSGYSLGDGLRVYATKDVAAGGNADNGYAFEANGSAKVDGILVLSGTVNCIQISGTNYNAHVSGGVLTFSNP